MVKCNTMADVRREIDRIDRELVKLLAERQTYIEQAGIIKGERSAVRDEARIEAEIARQVDSVADTLGIEPAAVFPVSAQKGLVARIQGDAALLERSRVPVLERALSEDLLPTKQEIVREDMFAETHEVIAATRGLLEARLGSLREQLQELTNLRGKNQSVIEYMMRKIRSE